MASANRNTKNSGKSSGRRPSGKHTASQSGRKSQSGRRPAVEQEEFIRGEVYIILSFAAAVLLFLSNLHLCGVLGEFLRGIQLGVFGMVGYLIPFLVFLGTCFAIAGRGSLAARVKLLAGFAGILTICGLTQLLFGTSLTEGQKVMEFYRVSAQSGLGGGLVGGILSAALTAVIGKAGAYLVFLVILLISAVCITEKSVVKVVRDGSGVAYQRAREDMERRREYHAVQKEERRRLREEQRVRGVDLSSTTLTEPDHQVIQPSSPNMQPYNSEPEHPIPGDMAREAAAAIEERLPAPPDDFVGSIALPPEYLEDDIVPFEADGESPVVMRKETEPPVSGNMVIRGREALGAGNADGKILESEFLDQLGDEDLGPETAGTNYDGFYIPEEPKRVVTATGKVIETDTEMVKKKLESRKQELKESGELSVNDQIRESEQAPKKEYIYPPVTLLKRPAKKAGSFSEKEYKDTAIKLQQTLKDFGVGVTVTNISCGPSVTRYELHPEQGVKVSKIVGLADDIKLSLAAADIRIEAPIPGKSAVGIEVPNKENNMVYLRELLESDNFKKQESRLAFAVGKDIGGQVVVTDIAKMPHLLIAGATGSGKSVCINTLIMSIIFKSSPDDVKLIMVDPKVVELSVYNGIPHLLIPVVTDPKKAAGALNWGVAEMTDRYKKFADYNVRDLKGYNAKIEGLKDIENGKKPEKLPQIVIIVDELADLMMVAAGEVEDAICRLAQLARAAGIHLVIATQRPSVNVITGLIKANVPSRVAFAVSSGVDSRTIIDMNGAEKLLGKGDMLFYPAGYPKPQRVQGAFVSDQEVQQVVEFLTEQGMTSTYRPDVESQISAVNVAAGPGGSDDRDEYFEQAGRFIVEKEKASIGMLQRAFKIGFNRAARIMEQLADAGIVGEEEGTKPRKVLMTLQEFEEFIGG